MVKVIVAAFVIAAVALGIAYYHGGTRSFDPTAQGRAAQAALTTGMKWTQVIDAAGPPIRYCFKRKEKEKIGGAEIERILDGPKMKFDRPTFENALAGGYAPVGFRYYYYFNDQVAFSVHFDPNGVVEDIADDKTVADLLDQRK